MNEELKHYTGSRFVVLHETETGYVAARAMKDNNAGSVLICDCAGKLVGILTDRDLVVRSICEGLDPGLVELKFLMTRNPAAISVDQTSNDALWLMRGLGVRRMPIVSRQGKPTGLICLDDFLANGDSLSTTVSEIVRRQSAQHARLNPEGLSRRPQGAGPSPHSLSPEDYHSIIEQHQEGIRLAHADQSLGKMRRLAQSCLEEQGVFALDRDAILNGLRTFLACLVRRVVPGAAANFIAQLPSHLQDELLSQPAGPDRSVNRSLVERAIRRSLKLKNDSQARAAVVAFAETVTFSVTQGEVCSLCAQLPQDLRDAFETAMSPEIIAIPGARQQALRAAS